MLRVILVPIDDRLAAALSEGPDAFARKMGPRLGPVGADTARVVAAALARPGSTAPGQRSQAFWGGFLGMEAATAAVIGACAFLGPPDADGAVEITVETFAPFAGRGFASAMVGSLMARAKDAPSVRRVTAHIEPDHPHPAHILRSHGFEPDDTGRLWTWDRPTLG